MKNTIIVVLLVCALAGLTSITAAAPFADDYDFNYPDLSTTPTASNAASYQSSMGYDDFSHTNANAETAYNRLKNDAIFFVNGHGLKYDTGEKGGAIQFYDGQETWIVASRGPYSPGVSCYLSDYDNEITDVLLAVYVSCYSACTNTYNGNLLDVSVTDKGVDAAIGFSGLIDNGKSNYWSDQFWYRTTNSETIYNAAINAKGDSWWTFPFGYGGVDTIVLKGSTGNYLTPARYGS